MSKSFITAIALATAALTSTAAFAEGPGELPSYKEPVAAAAKIAKGAVTDVAVFAKDTPLPGQDRIGVSVYRFEDKTGQRKPNPVGTAGSLSSAVTQGAESFLIAALSEVGRGTWFKVIERSGFDNLIKERTIIQNTRAQMHGKDAKALPALAAADIIIEGGIIGYDSSVKTGGKAARAFGIGSDQRYSEDTVTVALRVVSVGTSEVLLNTITQKTLASTSSNTGFNSFFDVIKGRVIEMEGGRTTSEASTVAVQVAIEGAVESMIMQGAKKGLWAIQ